MSGWRRTASRVAGGACLALAFSATPAEAFEVQRVISPMGIEAWLIEDDTVPLVSVSFAFEGAGAVSDADHRLGLANLLSGMLDEGAGEYRFSKLPAGLVGSLNLFAFLCRAGSFYRQFEGTEPGSGIGL